MDNTWVKLYRKIVDNEIMKDHTALQVFIFLLIKVNKKTGEVTTGRFNASEYLGIKPSTFRDALYRLRDKYKIATLTSDNKKTTISLLNWAKYNPYKLITTPHNDTKPTPNRHQTDTIQDIKTIDIKTNDKSLYGNEDINNLISYLKEKLNLPLLDESLQTNRRYAYHCIRKFGLNKTKIAIDATAQSKFWHTKITSFKGLYYNAVKIVSSNREEVRSIDAEKVLVSKNEGRERISSIGGGIPSVEANISGGY